MNFLKKQENWIQTILKQNGYEVENVILIPSGKPEFGEFQYNGIMALAKKNQENPQELAKKIAEQLKQNENFEKVSVAGPGFINLTFSCSSLLKYSEELLLEENWFEKKESKKIIIDYGGPNVAKILHVGHLRSANIGEALKRLAKCLGHDVIGDVHLGDYGLQMGMVMLEIQTRYPNLSCFQADYQKEKVEDLPITNNDLIELYPIASKKAKEDEKVMEQARNITYLLQQNHPGYKALWRSIMDISLQDMKEVYEKLSVSFDLWQGESDAEKIIPEMMEYLNQKNIIKEKREKNLREN